VGLWSKLVVALRSWFVPQSEALAPEVEATSDLYVDPIDESIDLHHFAPRDIPSVVDEYLRAARAKGHREVRIIHGKGKGVQRARVQKQLAKHPLVASFTSDGLGSTTVVLKQKQKQKMKGM
jgi:DNA-nicking Smr family endonuclease